MGVCCIFGHRDFMGSEKVEELFKNEIRNCLKMKIFEFYIGDNGNFDMFATGILVTMKKQFPQIKIYLVLSYLKDVNSDIKEYRKENFDEVLYPPLEKVPFKYSIIKRNYWMIDNSDYIIFYVKYLGGAKKH